MTWVRFELLLLVVLGVASQSSCLGPLDCNGAECLDCSCLNGACKCGGGWSGDACATPFCKDRSGCSGHGDCAMALHSISCVCDTGYSGPRCKVADCKLDCLHGGFPNAACTACEGCLGAWTGKTCESWNSSAPLSTLQTQAASFALASQATLDGELKLNPLCRQSQECVGWGIDANTGSPALFPIVRLSYNPNSVPFNGFLEPLEAQVTEIVAPTVSYDTQVFPRMSDFTDYVDSTYSGALPPVGTHGIYAQHFPAVFNTYFQLKDDRALSVSRAQFAVVGMKLPQDSTNNYNFTFDKNALRAIQALPPAYDTAANKALFRTFFEKYGTSVAVESFQGGVLELYSSWLTSLADRDQFSNAMLLKDAEIDFTTATGLGGHEGTLEAVYQADRRLLPRACFGGDPTLCSNPSSWLNSVHKAPILVRLKHVPITQFVSDAGTRQALNDAITGYVKETEQAWNGLDKCPPTCNGRGTCSTGMSDCVCGVHTPSYGRMCSVLKYPVNPYGLVQLLSTFMGISPSKDNKAEWTAIRTTSGNVLKAGITQDNFPAQWKPILSILSKTTPSSQNTAEWTAIRNVCNSVVGKDEVTQFYTVVKQLSVTTPGKANRGEWTTIRTTANDILSNRP